MKESYKEFLARNFGPESYADQGNLLGVATAGVQLGRVIEFRNPQQFVRRHPGTIGRQHQGNRDGEIFLSTAESKTSCMAGNSKHENRDSLSVCCLVNISELLTPPEALQ